MLKNNRAFVCEKTLTYGFFPIECPYGLRKYHKPYRSPGPVRLPVPVVHQRQMQRRQQILQTTESRRRCAIVHLQPHRPIVLRQLARRPLLAGGTPPPGPVPGQPGGPGPRRRPRQRPERGWRDRQPCRLVPPQRLRAQRRPLCHPPLRRRRPPGGPLSPPRLRRAIRPGATNQNRRPPLCHLSPL